MCCCLAYRYSNDKGISWSAEAVIPSTCVYNDGYSVETPAHTEYYDASLLVGRMMATPGCFTARATKW